MPATQVIIAVTQQEFDLLEVLRREPLLVENLRKCTAPESHQRAMLERLRLHLIRAKGAQVTADKEKP